MKNIVNYIVGLLVSDKGWFNETKNGWTFRKVDWNNFSLDELGNLVSKLNAKSDDEYKVIYAEGTDINPRTQAKDKNGDTLATTYLWIGKETADIQTKEDLLKSMNI